MLARLHKIKNENDAFVEFDLKNKIINLHRGQDKFQSLLQVSLSREIDPALVKGLVLSELKLKVVGHPAYIGRRTFRGYLH